MASNKGNGSKDLGSERRKAPRVAVELVIQYSNVESFCQDYARNLSLGGIFIETESPLHVGCPLQLSFALPGYDGIIQSEARVVRSVTQEEAVRQGERPGMAVQFEDLPEETKAIIDTLVRREFDTDDYS